VNCPPIQHLVGWLRRPTCPVGAPLSMSSDVGVHTRAQCSG
jgi:hypothetical protein